MVDEDIFYYLIRPDSLRIWSYREVRERLDWYYNVMKKIKPPRYIIAKHIPIPKDIQNISSLDLESLYDLHKDLRKEFLDVYSRIREGSINISELDEYENNFLELKIEIVKRLVNPCRLCERRCMVNRLNGRRGVCGLDGVVRVASAFLHMGEEAPLIPSGTIFFTGCSFKCVFCIDPEEFLVVKINDVIQVLKMKDLVHIEPSRIKVLTPNGWRNIKLIIGRISDEIYKLETVDGRSIRLTPEHIVICRKGFSLKECKVSSLKIGDELVYLEDIIHYYPMKRIYTLNLSRLFRSFLSKEYLDNTKIVTQTFNGILVKYIYPSEINEIPIDGESFPRQIHITPHLTRLIGYFLRRGFYSSKGVLTIRLENDNLLNQVVESVKNILLEIKLDISSTADGYEVKIRSYPLYLLFKYFLGVKDDGIQHIPSLMFYAPPYSVSSFILSLIEDIDSDDMSSRLTIYVDNEWFKYELIYLLSLNKIRFTVMNLKSNKIIKYMFLIDSHDVSRLFNFSIGNETDNVVLMSKESGRDHGSAVIKSIKIEKTRKLVYDIVIDGKDNSLMEHVFFAGDGILIHNCQNWDISQRPFNGEVVTPESLASLSHALAVRGAKNINYVGGNPDQNMHVIIESLRYLDDWIPLLWNSNMYMTRESLDVLLDIIDIWLPDFKYGNNQCGFKFSRVKDYYDIIPRNLKIVYEYGGEMIIRHLVLPNHVDCCTKPILKWISLNTPNVLINIMDQYRPDHMVLREPWRFKEINRRVYSSEMQEAYEYARKLKIVFEPIS